MTNLILKLFVRDYKDTENPAVREKCGRVAGLVGIVTNLLLFAMKIAVGTLFNSVSITADAVNNLTDSGSSIVTLVGFKLAGKPADKEHPFGHARIEYLSGVIVSFIVVFLGLQLGLSSVQKIVSPEENALTPAALLVLVILLGVGMTFLVCKLLSKTILKGVPSSFTLELPPYRRPQIGKVIVRSVLDRTLFVLGRAAAVALPAGVLIWVMANVTVEERTLLMHCAGFLDPFAGLLGLDGVILLAFILGLPANEIVVPIILMAYLAQGSLAEMADYASLHALLVANGWTWVTALCTMLFSLFHWPCSTTLMTIKKETQSLKWTVASFLIPTGCGVALCMAVNAVAALFGA